MNFIVRIRSRRKLIRSILALAYNGRIMEIEIDRKMTEALTNSRINPTSHEQTIMAQARAFVSDLSLAFGRLDYLSLGDSPIKNPKFVTDEKYWSAIKPKWFEFDLRISKWIWVKQSARWLSKRNRKRMRKPACRKYSLGTLTRLERVWFSLRQQQQAMLDNTKHLPYSFPLAVAIEAAEAGDDQSFTPSGYYSAVADRNRQIQTARIELTLAEEHIAKFSDTRLPMCLEGTDITKGWKERARDGRQLALTPRWNEYVEHSRSLIEDIQKGFQMLYKLHNAESTLIEAMRAIKLLKLRYKNFKPPMAELKQIDKLLSELAPSAWLENDWMRLNEVAKEQAQKMINFSMAIEAWLRVNQIPLDIELAECLKNLPEIEIIMEAADQQEERDRQSGYIEAGELGTQVDPMWKDIWNGEDNKDEGNDQ